MYVTQLYVIQLYYNRGGRQAEAKIQSVHDRAIIPLILKSCDTTKDAGFPRFKP